ncbi:mycofactocin-coupled SDR family oxidoreductase [Streptomyces sp. HC44]|uniref:Mycofactocin-coupled SDR family oxidoreductase n=1 Tax=Streptomyces scabichelini TaxID=2711217 RepID=A0A6G4V895_9ACTN|nr:mycofactocin-coupled SDR family oxidoreductase [Streptomyces scabichelini]NGO10044.1 mycofactocin-coupled SDR family oxidoreductase [Streptomyces scabichelini]
MNRMSGQVVLVTGAARGQGRNHAVRLAEEGADIIALDICAPISELAYPMATEEDLATTEKLVRDRGRSIVTAKVDVRDFAAVKEAVDRGVRELGGLDVVVANAGVVAGGRFEEQSLEVWRVILDVNVLGVRNTCLAAQPHLTADDGGSVILISSVSGLVAGASMSAYTASKHGVVGLAKALAIEWGPHNIRVNAVAPGAVRGTGMGDGRGLGLDELSSKEQASYATALSATSVERDDTSHAVLYLASAAARYVTGTVLNVDAGMAVI